MVGRIVVLLAIACYVDANASEATPPVCDKIFAAAASLVQNKNQRVSEAKLRDSLPSVDAAKSASGTPQAVLLEAMHAMLGEVYEGPTPEMTVYSTYRAEVCVRNMGGGSRRRPISHWYALSWKRAHRCSVARLIVDFSFGIVGFFAGVMLWSRVVHLTFAIYNAATKVDLVALLKAPTESQVRRFLVVGFFSSLGWIVCFAVAAWHCAENVPPSDGWASFWGGLAFGPLPACYFTIRAVRRMRERGQSKGSTRPMRKHAAG